MLHDERLTRTRLLFVIVGESREPWESVAHPSIQDVHLALHVPRRQWQDASAQPLPQQQTRFPHPSSGISTAGRVVSLREPPRKSVLTSSVPEGDQASIDFQNPAALRALTEALLKVDFGYTVHLREDRLCPTVCSFCCLRRAGADVRSPTGSITSCACSTSSHTSLLTTVHLGS